MQQFVLCINGRYFKTNIQDSRFLDFLQTASRKDFPSDCVDEKELLAAYIKKSSELYEKEQKIKELLDRLELDLSKTSV